MNFSYSKYVVIHFILLILLSWISCNRDQQVIKPNILFIISDQHRGDAIAAAGHPVVYTPNLDKLAAEGVLFSRAYSSVPSCLPARTAILTGMSPWASGQLGYRPIPDYPLEGPAIFFENGYMTYAVGKNHFTPMREKHGYQTVVLEEAWYTALGNQEKCDYTIWFENNYPGKDLNASGLGYTDHRGGRIFPFEEKAHPTVWTADIAIEFLESYEADEPWLLKVSFKRPHPPFDPPDKWSDYYNSSSIDLPEVGAWAMAKYGQNTGSLEQSPSATNGAFPNHEIISSRHAYYASISHVDEQIGRLLKTLKAQNQYNNTLILYTSDHGDMMGDHHLWRKCRPYEGSVNIPMIMRWPENLKVSAKRGIYSNELVELRDIFPTFLDAAGFEIPDAMDGSSMLNVLRGEEWRDMLDLEHSQIYEPDNAWVALTDSRYKYIYFTLTGEEQLFDLRDDPKELNDITNLQNPPQNLIEEWRRNMISHLEERGEKWVLNGQLVIQDSSIHYGPNHPNYDSIESK